jgi:hypothetical protein
MTRHAGLAFHNGTRGPARNHAARIRRRAIHRGCGQTVAKVTDRDG